MVPKLTRERIKESLDFLLNRKEYEVLQHLQLVIIKSLEDRLLKLDPKREDLSVEYAYIKGHLDAFSKLDQRIATERSIEKE